MVLSKRERFVAIAALSSIGILTVDRLAFTPLLAASNFLDKEVNDCQQKLLDARGKIDGRRHRSRQWAQMQKDGLRRKDASAAETWMLNSIRDWAQEAQMTLLSVKPDRMEKENAFAKITFRVTGAGGMGQIGRFLWHVQTAVAPLRITDLQITTRKEATDDLSVQLGISTIYLLPESDKEPVVAPASGPREGES